jgi:hypothetical protein
MISVGCGSLSIEVAVVNFASTWPCVVIVTVSVVIAVVEKRVVVVVLVSAFVKYARDTSNIRWKSRTPSAPTERSRIVMICCRDVECLVPEECETGSGVRSTHPDREKCSNNENGKLNT